MFVLARSQSGKNYVGIVTEDGRARVDVDSLHDIKFYDAIWIDPANPWLGAKSIGNIRSDLVADFT